MVKPSGFLAAAVAALMVSAAALAQGGGELYELSQDFFSSRFAVTAGEYELADAPGHSDGVSYSEETYSIEGAFWGPPFLANVNVNTAPQAVNDLFSVSANSANNVLNVLANDSDRDGNPIALVTVGQAAIGSTAITARGANVIFAPKPGFAGVDAFSYAITDGMLTSSASVTVMVWKHQVFLPQILKGAN